MMAGTSSCRDGESKALAINGMLTNLYNVCATLIYRTLSDFRHTNIYVTPDLYFTTKLREIFQKTKLRHTTSVESRHWLRAWHEILAATTQLCHFLRYTRVWNFSWHIWKQNKSASSDCKSFLYLSRVFHNQTHFVPARRYSEHERFARRSDIQSFE